MIIYHGSPEIVKNPRLEKGKLHNDYGQGFYCTRDHDLACEWACPRENGHGFINSYGLDTNKLSVLNLDEDPNGAIGWAATLMKYRPVNFTSGGPDKGTLTTFIERYACDFSNVDAIEGYRADDSYFNIMRAFIYNTITVEHLERALRLGGLGKQVVLKSARAFENIEFKGAQCVECNIWNPLREARNRNARDVFASSLTRNGQMGSRPNLNAKPYEEGTFFIDLLRQL